MKWKPEYTIGALLLLLITLTIVLFTRPAKVVVAPPQVVNNDALFQPIIDSLANKSRILESQNEKFTTRIAILEAQTKQKKAAAAGAIVKGDNAVSSGNFDSLKVAYEEVRDTHLEYVAQAEQENTERAKLIDNQRVTIETKTLEITARDVKHEALKQDFTALSTQFTTFKQDSKKQLRKEKRRAWIKGAIIGVGATLGTLLVI